METIGASSWPAFSRQLHVNAADGPAQAVPLGVAKPPVVSREVRALIREMNSANRIVKLGRYAQTRWRIEVVSPDFHGHDAGDLTVASISVNLDPVRVTPPGETRCGFTQAEMTCSGRVVGASRTCANLGRFLHVDLDLDLDLDLDYPARDELPQA
jgi:hypothetical protein